MKNPWELSGKSVVVTGASSGIGQAVAVLLSETGARIVLVARNRERLQATQAMLSGKGHRVAVMDLGETESIEPWFEQLVSKEGPFDGLVHSAGIGALLPLRSVTSEYLKEIMLINVFAAVALTKAFARKHSHRSGSSIVLVASVAGMVGIPARTAYSASKGAVIAFARSAAMELAKSGIRVNCVAPAYVETEMLQQDAEVLSPDRMKHLVEAGHPLGLGRPLDVAYSIAFLLAETGRWITGSVLTVDGGYSAQ
jgi:NAD(P)-dependent dehydrogenase (short-subunit alcohol dehydrogenase family)